MQGITVIDLLSIILSIVALVITIVGFFASLKFYRDGVNLQERANNALTKLEERTQFIQSQVGGMFDKTLDAAIGKRELLTENFSALNEQLEATKKKIVEESLREIGDFGEQERKKLIGVIENQIELVKQKVETTRESVEDVSSVSDQIPRPDISRIIFALLHTGKGGMTIEEIAEKLGIDRREVTYQLGRLSRQNKVTVTQGHRYSASTKKS